MQNHDGAYCVLKDRPMTDCQIPINFQQWKKKHFWQNGNDHASPVRTASINRFTKAHEAAQSVWALLLCIQNVCYMNRRNCICFSRSHFFFHFRHCSDSFGPFKTKTEHKNRAPTSNHFFFLCNDQIDLDKKLTTEVRTSRKKNKQTKTANHTSEEWSNWECDYMFSPF